MGMCHGARMPIAIIGGGSSFPIIQVKQAFVFNNSEMKENVLTESHLQA